MDDKLFKLIISLIGMVVAAITAWELKGRIAARDRRLDKELEDGVMEAVIASEADDGRSVRQTATVQYSQGRYRLLLRSDASGSTQIVHDVEFADRAGLEVFLEQRTLFRLGDFVRC